MMKEEERKKGERANEALGRLGLEARPAVSASD